MTFDPSIFAPDGISLWLAAFLIALSFLTSMLTAFLGLGGGIAMLAVLGIIFPPAIAIPVHGGVQLGSNVGRAAIQHHYVRWQLVIWFGIGSFIGAAIGGSLAISLPEALFRLLIALFILYSVWGPQPNVAGRGPLASLIGGTVMGGLGMLVGGVGPLAANFVKHLPDRRQVIATHAVLMAFNNTAKVTTFAVLGFAFGRYLPLILAMIVAGFIGTVMGSRFLDRMAEESFRLAFRIVLTVLALEMLRAAIFG